MPLFFMPYMTICLKGTSTTPADTVTIPEWDASTAIRDAKGPQPGTAFGSLTAAAVTAAPAPDDHPGSEIKRNSRVATLAVLADGTSGATAKAGLATTTAGVGSGLTVNLTAAGGKVTGITVGNAAGAGYEMGDVITVAAAAAGTGADVKGVVTGVAL